MIEYLISCLYFNPSVPAYIVTTLVLVTGDMCQLGVDQIVPGAPTRKQTQPNIHDTELGTACTIEDNHVRVCDLHSLSIPRAGLVNNSFQEIPPDLSSLEMATSSDPLQRPKFQYSQSFRQQSTQDALAEVAPSARPSDSTDPLVGADIVTSKSGGTGRQLHNTDVPSLSEENLQHRLNASGSVQAIVVDDDVLFAGLQGGDIVVSIILAITVLFAVKALIATGVVARYI